MLVFALFPHNSEWFFLVVSKMFKTETIIFVKKSYVMAYVISYQNLKHVCFSQRGDWDEFQQKHIFSQVELSESL